MKRPCSGNALIGQQCPKPAIWRNQNGVEVCQIHKTLLDAYTWEGKNKRTWERITEQNGR